MEFCAGIPGSVGGGIRMNAGAYGSELKDVIESVSLLDGEGNIKSCRREALQFQYRNLALPEGSCVAGGVFVLARGSREAVEGRIREILRTRTGKHPLDYRNAGSIFKNPKGMPAGKIIDEAGLKGARIGGAQVSEKARQFHREPRKRHGKGYHRAHRARAGEGPRGEGHRPGARGEDHRGGVSCDDRSVPALRHD